MSTLGWFVVAFVAQSIGVIILWAQLLRQERYSKSMGDFLEVFAMATMKHIEEIKSKAEISDAEDEQVNRNPIGFRV